MLIEPSTSPVRRWAPRLILASGLTLALLLTGAAAAQEGAAQEPAETPDKPQLLRTFKERAKDPSLSPADRVEWALDAGLLEEGFKLGDELLEEHPRDLDLRVLAASRAMALVRLPERGTDGELDALMGAGAAATPMVREAVLERLAMAAPRAEILSAVQADLASKSAARRAHALFVTGRLFPREDPRGVLLSSIYDPSPEARRLAARAIGDIGAETVALPLVNALDAKSPKVRQRAAEALGHARDDSFVEPLMNRLLVLSAPAAAGTASRVPHSYLYVGTQTAYVQDFDVEVAQGSSVADPVINVLTQGAVLDVGIVGIQDVTIVTERRIIRGALKRITGANPGRKTKNWKSWWEDRESARYRDLAAPVSGRATR